MAFDVQRARAKFPGLAREEGGRPVAFLDAPAGTQVPTSVVECMNDVMLHKNSNSAGYFSTSREADAALASAHYAAEQFVNARRTGEVFFGQSMTSLTFAMSRSLGASFKAGDEIVLSRMDHDANISPWLMLAEDRGLVIRWLEFSPETHEFNLEDLDHILSDRTKLVCVCYASNVTGTINDIGGIARRAHRMGALVYVDAVQFAQHGLIDVQALDCDFLVCSGYKFYGPHCSLLWGRTELLEALRAYKVRPAPEQLPWRFTLGTSCREGVVGVQAAIEYLGSLGTEFGGVDPGAPLRTKLAAGLKIVGVHENVLTSRLIAGIQSVSKSVKILGISDPSAYSRRVSTVSFSVPGHKPDSIARYFGSKGLQIWSGDHYGVEPTRVLGLSGVGGGIRVGPVHYNTIEEVDRVTETLDQYLNTH